MFSSLISDTDPRISIGVTWASHRKVSSLLPSPMGCNENHFGAAAATLALQPHIKQIGIKQIFETMDLTWLKFSL